MGVICVLIVVVSGFSGYYLTEKYRQRKVFYAELAKFVDYLISNIKFMQTKTEKLFYDYKTTSKLFLKFKSEAVERLNNKKYKFTCLNFLSLTEINEVNLILDNLGSLDLSGVISNLENAKELIKSKTKQAENEANIKVGLTLKLSIIFGLALAIILI